MDEHVEGNIAFQMARIIFRMDQELRRDVLRRFDISYTHFRVLQFLYSRDRQPIGAISKAIVMQHAVVSRIVDQMERRELVERCRRPDDARVVDIVLTSKGRQIYQDLWPQARLILDHAFSKMGDRQRSMLLKMLHEINEAIND